VPQDGRNHNSYRKKPFFRDFFYHGNIAASSGYFAGGMTSQERMISYVERRAKGVTVVKRILVREILWEHGIKKLA
jgi:hypothetical protein